MQLREISPNARIEWKRCADVPVSWYRPQVVVNGQKIYVGGGVTADLDMFTVLEYDLVGDTWKLHSQSKVVLYGLSYFQGQLITVGGCNIQRVSANVSSYEQLKGKWEEKIPPMPIARSTPTVISTDTAIIVCGGAILDHCQEPIPCKLVQVYSSETLQWHRSAQLLHPYAAAPSVVIGEYCFLVGEATEKDGSRKVTYANTKDLISLRSKGEDPALAHSNSSSSELQVWKELPECPLIGSAAVCINGALLTLGGDDNSKGVDTITVNQVHTFMPQTNSWIELKDGGLQEALGGSSAAQLLDNNRVVIVGGSGPDDKNSVSMFIGTLV
jgi:N-acetylneuraminic acid mutarotase